MKTRTTLFRNKQLVRAGGGRRLGHDGTLESALAQQFLDLELVLVRLHLQGVHLQLVALRLVHEARRRQLAVDGAQLAQLLVQHR